MPVDDLNSLLDNALNSVGALHEAIINNGKKLQPAFCGQVEALLEKTIQLSYDADEIRQPKYCFDPSNQETLAKLVILGLIAQEKEPIGALTHTYGSGVYAIYYTGNHPFYAPISNTETPIYVGKADPANPSAQIPKEQGDRLYRRLADHYRMIQLAQNYQGTPPVWEKLNSDDFFVRRLVCVTNSQLVAEKHLIQLFKPAWNSEMRVCWGISKHGDKASTRKNDRSPWDVLHPGRSWAMDPILKDKMTVSEIECGLKNHFKTTTIFHDRNEVIAKILESLRQV